MSYIYSFENKLIRDPSKDNLYNLQQWTVAYNIDVNIYEHIVTQQEEMRLDTVCYNLYGSYSFFEELMTINNIKNPWSIKQGDIVYFLQNDDMNRLYLKEPVNPNDYKKLIDPTKNTKNDSNRAANQPSAKSPNLQPVQIDVNAGIIKVVDKLS
jgi:hypothetical protein